MLIPLYNIIKMEEIKDLSIHHTAVKLSEEMKKMESYKQLYSEIQKLTSSPAVEKEGFKGSLLAAMKDNGLETELRNTVYHWVRAQKKVDVMQKATDPYTFLRKCQCQWEKRILKSLNSMGTELNEPLVQERDSASKEQLQQEWEGLSNYVVDLTNYRPVYAPKDFLEVLLSLNGPDSQAVEGRPKWEFAHIPIRVKTMTQLRMHFMEITRLNVAASPRDTNPLTDKILSAGHAPLAQEALKGGAVIQHRAALWMCVLGSNLKTNQDEHLSNLKQNVLDFDYVTDKLIIKDIQLTASNDDQYFVFEDVLYQVMLCFSRDTQIYKLLQSDAPAILKATLKNKSSESHSIPPSGIIPIHGITMYAAPFCYVFDNVSSLYHTFRAFYVRYCHRLTTMSTHPQGIICLCLLFERLLQTHEPELWAHLRNAEVQPIRLVFKWIMRAFSGHLQPQQVLILWDLVLGYDSLEIISLLAVVIISFRRDSLMEVQDQQSMETVLADLSSIKILPLIQMALVREQFQ